MQSSRRSCICLSGNNQPYYRLLLVIMSSRRRTRSSSCNSRGNDKRRRSVTRADQSRNLFDNPSANLLSRPLTQKDIPNIVQQVLPNIVQQVLATFQPPESARVEQKMDAGTRSSARQQSANTIESNTTSSGATDSSGTTDRTSVVSNLVDEYLQTEVSLGRVVGHFPLDALPAAHISRFGVIPKGHQPDKW